MQQGTWLILHVNTGKQYFYSQKVHSHTNRNHGQTNVKIWTVHDTEKYAVLYILGGTECLDPLEIFYWDIYANQTTCNERNKTFPSETVVSGRRWKEKVTRRLRIWNIIKRTVINTTVSRSTCKSIARIVDKRKKRVTHEYVKEVS